ncbi:MAG TPA: outer membrane beta-barrel protein [Chitinophagaceae bacterium]|nr:outer membrane beta-barrel protein [Chitinophagaceae bacterium]
MKKLLILPFLAFLTFSAFSQENPRPPKKAIDMSNRANDHFLLQFGYTSWAGKPDSINTKGLSKSINVYFMFDFPFKTNPKLSMAFGPGISTDHILFRNTYVGIKDPTNTIHFKNQADTNHFKKTKLATAYLEAPIELRFSANPETGKGFKAAVGVKVGTLLNAHTRNTKFEDKNGNALNDYVMKESSKRFMNKTRISAQARFGYGHFTLYGAYQLTPLFRDGAGPSVRPFSIGITLSGL